MTTTRLVKINGVAVILAALILANTTSPVTAAPQVTSAPAAAKNIKVGEDDIGDFIHDVAVGAYAGAAWGAIAGAVAGLPIGAEAGAVTSFYAGAAYAAVMYWLGGDDDGWELTGSKGKLPATVLD